MSPEACATIGVGVALAGLILRMSQRVDGLAARVDGLAARVDALSERVAALGARVAAIEGFLRGRAREPWHGDPETPEPGS
ncbi:MAG: hypothetical protein OYK82_01560 [Gammaproteobacteria bacterium]|nr:hypothetical protein [Gammaproteobacteria bacterium]